MTKSEKIIRKYSDYAMVAGLAPVPLFDLVSIGAIQLKMIAELCKVYDKKFDANQAEIIVAAISSSLFIRYAASPLKLIPYFGLLIGGLTVSTLAGKSTRMIGEAFDKHLAEGGDIFNLDINKLKEKFKNTEDKASVTDDKNSD